MEKLNYELVERLGFDKNIWKIGSLTKSPNYIFINLIEINKTNELLNSDRGVFWKYKNTDEWIPFVFGEDESMKALIEINQFGYTGTPSENGR